MAASTGLSRSEALRLALVAQGLAGPRIPGPKALIDVVGSVQLDTIVVLRRSHLLVAFARLGATSEHSIEAAYWPTSSPTTFEYWSHAACILPIDRWPAFAFRRRAFLARGRRFGRLVEPDSTLAAVRERLAAGPATASDLGGATGGGTWWDWTEEKIAVEWLLQIGEVVCTRRDRWRRVYDLAERAIPPALLESEPDDSACWTMLVEDAARRLGVATLPELARHHALKINEARAVISNAGLVPVAVEGTPEPCWAHPELLERAGRQVRSRTTLLSPFDSLIWDRPRTERLFGFSHRIEAYTPKPKRVYGYFPMPVLSAGRLVGRVDPAREGSTLVIKRVDTEPAAIEAVANAIGEAASWVGCSAVRIELVTPAQAEAPLRQLVAAKTS